MAIAGFFGGDAPQQPAPDTLFVPAFANSSALLTPDGVVLVDWGHEITGPGIHAKVRDFTEAPCTRSSTRMAMWTTSVAGVLGRMRGPSRP